MILYLCEGKPGLIVDIEHLLNGVDVGRRPEVQTQVVLARRAHDLLEKQKRSVITPSLYEWRVELDSTFNHNPKKSNDALYWKTTPHCQ